MRFVIVGLCAFAVGLLSGLFVEAMTGGSVPELRQKNADLEARLEKTEESLRESIAARAAIVQERDVSKRIAEAKAAKEGDVHIQRDLLLIQVALLNSVLCIIRDNPGMVDLIRHPAFARNFRADWYFPDSAFRELGGRWFLQEVRRLNAAPPEILKFLDEISKDWKE